MAEQLSVSNIEPQLDAVLEALAGVDQEYRNQAMPPALRAAARVHLRAARARVKTGKKKKPKPKKGQRPTRLKLSTRVITIRKYSRVGRPRTGDIPDIAVAFGFYAPHAWLVEHGHGGPKPAPPHPYLIPAVEATQGPAFQAAVTVLDNEFPNIAAKARRIAGLPR